MTKPPANWPFPTWRGQPIKRQRVKRAPYPPGDPAPF